VAQLNDEVDVLELVLHEIYPGLYDWQCLLACTEVILLRFLHCSGGCNHFGRIKPHFWGPIQTNGIQGQH
jgi:hypothetical protein